MTIGATVMFFVFMLNIHNMALWNMSLWLWIPGLIVPTVAARWLYLRICRTGTPGQMAAAAIWVPILVVGLTVGTCAAIPFVTE